MSIKKIEIVVQHDILSSNIVLSNVNFILSNSILYDKYNQINSQNLPWKIQILYKTSNSCQRFCCRSILPLTQMWMDFAN